MPAATASAIRSLVHAALPGEAAAAFKRLEDLGRYEYSVSEHETWRFTRGSQPPEEILPDLPNWGNVYARCVR
jgi:hypothetical protein